MRRLLSQSHSSRSLLYNNKSAHENEREGREREQHIRAGSHILTPKQIVAAAAAAAGGGVEESSQP